MVKLTSALLLSLGLSTAQGRTVAFTFDDLPIAAGGDALEARQVNSAILSVLAKHHAVATAFVNDQTVQRIGTAEGRAILQLWVDRGNELGNHTFSHPDLNEISVEQFKDEVIRGETCIAQLSGGKRPQYLRFPFNHTGDTKEKHDAVAKFLLDAG
jgi:peptidoglycan/xylan/chitin deacetylase (PgdA/CDA1 family)